MDTSFPKPGVIDMDFAAIEARIAAQYAQAKQAKKVITLTGKSFDGALFWEDDVHARTAKHPRQYAREARVIARHEESLKALADAHDRRWAEAFFQVIRASPDHYAWAEPRRRRYLEQRTTKQAQGEGRHAERARRILAHVFSAALEGEKAGASDADPWPHLTELSQQFTTGRTSGRAP